MATPRTITMASPDDLDFIPVDKSLEQFKAHLATHPRTIFSAGYGEGKTYFLDTYRHQSDDTIITLYPVNYQVADNRDVFDLIKHDILFQLFDRGLLDNDAPISKSVYLSFYLGKKFTPQWAIDNIAELNYPGNHTAGIIARTIRYFSRAKADFDAFQNQIHKPEADFWDRLASEGVYDSDPVTLLIRDTINRWKATNPDRRIILLVEDLDRIDPAHLFRILNVLSAHIDYCNHLGIQADPETTAENKFGFDNIVLVFDYNNASSIFHHFYGPNTCWDGYINKFSTRGIFTYSLSFLKINYFYEHAAKICSLPVDYMRVLVPLSAIETLSIRRIRHSLKDIPQQVSPLPTVTIRGLHGTLPGHLLYLMAILRRIGLDDTDITSLMRNTVTHNNLHTTLVIPYHLLSENPSCRLTLGENENGARVEYTLDITADGSPLTVTRQRMIAYVKQKPDTTLNDLLAKMLTYVNR